MMKKYDVVIVGTGLGGLICGYILSKNGYSVCLLEKNRQIGGCLQTFTRKGIKFDTGMHYIGSMEPGQILHRFFTYLQLANSVKLRKLNTDGFDVISYKDDIYKYGMGFDNFIDTLAKKFPNERENISNYIRGIRDIAQASPLYNLREINAPTFIEASYIKSSVNNYINSVTNNPDLRNVLVANCSLYAGIADKTPLYIHALINNFYIQSAWRIIGGSDTIASSLANSIRHFGGDIFTETEVDKFDTSDKEVLSVTLTNGEKIFGDKYISNIHPQATIERIESHMIRRAYRDRINSLENTISTFTLFMIFKPNTVKYLNYNFYKHNVEDVWSTAYYTSEDWPRSFLYMHQADTPKQDYANSGQIIAYMNYNDVVRWENTTVGHRGSDYDEFKRQKAEILLAQLEKAFPGTIQNIDSYYTSSPLTYRDYTYTKDGSTYGVLRDCNFPTQTLVSQRTKIPNLYLTGQNINSHGILGVTIGAIITCAEFLGINQIIKEINE